MKPKLDWVHTQIQKQAQSGFPETAGITLIAIYDLTRIQRNELAASRETPPNVRRQDAFVHLPGYYETAKAMLGFIAVNSV